MFIDNTIVTMSSSGSNTHGGNTSSDSSGGQGSNDSNGGNQNDNPSGDSIQQGVNDAIDRQEGIRQLLESTSDAVKRAREKKK